MIEVLTAVLDVLRAGFVAPVLSSTNCDIQEAGHPPPAAPVFYISVDETSVSAGGTSSQFELNEEHHLSVWLSMRVGPLAPDRYSQFYRQYGPNLRNCEAKVKELLHGKWEVITAANAYLVSWDIGGADFITPLYFSGRSATTLRGPDWSREDGVIETGWLVRELPFVGARRIQYLDSIT